MILSETGPRYYSLDEITMVVGWLFEGLDLMLAGRSGLPPGQDKAAVERVLARAGQADLPGGLSRPERLRYRLAGLVAACIAGEER